MSVPDARPGQPGLRGVLPARPGRHRRCRWPWSRTARWTSAGARPCCRCWSSSRCPRSGFLAALLHQGSPRLDAGPAAGADRHDPGRGALGQRVAAVPDAARRPAGRRHQGARLGRPRLDRAHPDRAGRAGAAAQRRRAARRSRPATARSATRSRCPASRCAGWSPARPHSSASLTDLDGDALQALTALATANLSRRQLTDEMAYQAQHDLLTGLPNRALLSQRLETALATGGKTSVLYCDLDGFKAVNDRFGHDVGDELLVAVADRLRQSLRARDLLARLGGDEFAVVVSHNNIVQAEDIAGRLLESLQTPFLISGNVTRIQASIGIAHSGDELQRQRPDARGRHGDVPRQGPGQEPDRRLRAVAALRDALPPGDGGRAAPGAGRGPHPARTSSRWSTWSPARSSASRPWPAGSTRRSGRSPPRSSSRWPSSRA